MSEEEYCCQFCHKSSPAEEWEHDECPHCGKAYDWLLAQDSE